MTVNKAVTKQSLGGVARAEKMTPEQRSEAARKAAIARWGDGARIAIREAPLIVDIEGVRIEFECAVLDDETRVLSERAFSRAIGAKRGGSHWLRQKANPDGANLPVFLSAKNLSPFISLDLASALSEPVLYQTQSGKQAHGIEASRIPEILEVWLKAKDAGKLTKSQEKFAELAEILVRALAKTGIVALVDEATGFQHLRAHDSLIRHLERWVAKDLRKWVKTFPPEYTQQLCRLQGVDYPPKNNQLPQYFGHLTNDVVYDRLAPGLRQKLQKENPTTSSGRRRHRHHQLLTEHIGLPALREHLSAVTVLMTVSDSWDHFKDMLDKAIPKHENLPPTLFDQEDDAAE